MSERNFIGALTLVDTPSRGSPGGAGGHRILLLQSVAEKALPSLLKRPLLYKPGFRGHHQPQSGEAIGIILGAEIKGGYLMVWGWVLDQPLLGEMDRERLRIEDLGMSFDAKQVTVRDIRRPIWELCDVPFTGATLVRRGWAAYPETWFRME